MKNPTFILRKNKTDNIGSYIIKGEYMFHLIAKLVEKHGEMVTFGYWKLKLGCLTIAYEVTWFIDHSNFHFNFYIFDKEIYYKLIQGTVPPCEF